MSSYLFPIDDGKSKTPLYQAIWADNGSFDTIIVSPSMIEDHMPNTVLDAMQQVCMCSYLLTISNYPVKKFISLAFIFWRC